MNDLRVYGLIQKNLFDFGFELYTNIKKYMNQRSISMKQPKTSLQNDISFEKKISKAIKDKKQFIASMTHHKTSTHQLATYRLSPFHRTRQNLKTEQAVAQKPPIKTVQIPSSTMQSYLEENNISEGTCVNHLSKKAAFEQKYARSNRYCHECAIKMVKNDGKVVGISQQSLMLGHLLEQQLDLIQEEQRKVVSIVQEYYSDLRTRFQNMYLLFLEQRCHQPEIVHFGSFSQDQSMLEKIRECLGKVEPVKFKFIHQHLQEKENMLTGQNQPKTEKQTQDVSQKLLSINIALESNRSLENKSQRSTKRVIRSRENSDYRKGPNQPMKTLNLR